MMHASRFFLPIALAAACCPASAAAPIGIRELVESFDSAQARADTIVAPFTLTIQRAMLRAPAVSTGTLYLSGSDCAHFEFAPPEDLAIHLTNKTLLTLNRAEKKGEALQMRLIKKVDRKALSLGRKLASFSDYFKLEATEAENPGEILVTLRPRSLSMKKRTELVQVWMDKQTNLPKRFKWVERGGDAWLLELGRIRTNAAIPAPVLNFALPPGIQAKRGFSFFDSKGK